MSDHCCGSGDKRLIARKVLETTPAEVKMRKGGLLLDVRGPDEFSGELGHIEGAVLKTLGPELEEYLHNLPKSDDLIFVCRSGARSGRAAELALSLGFTRAYNMVGGMLAWNAEGFEIKR